MSLVIVEPSRMSWSATTTLTRFQPRRASASRRLIAAKASAPAKTPSPRATRRGVLPLNTTCTRSSLRQGAVEQEVIGIVLDLKGIEEKLDEIFLLFRAGNHPYGASEHEGDDQQPIQDGVLEHRLTAHLKNCCAAPPRLASGLARDVSRHP